MNNQKVSHIVDYYHYKAMRHTNYAAKYMKYLWSLGDGKGGIKIK